MKKQSSFEEVVQYAKKLTHPKFMDVTYANLFYFAEFHFLCIIQMSNIWTP